MASTPRRDCIAQMARIPDNVIGFSDPQLDAANLLVTANQRHIEFVGWHIALGRVAGILFDKNQLQISVDQ